MVFDFFDSAVLAGYISIGPASWGQLFIWIGCAIASGLLAGSLVSTFVCVQITEAGREWPTRRTYVLAALFFTGIAIYGSFVPWHYQPLDWQSAVSRFAETPYLNLGIGLRADWVANILLFIPISFFWMAVITLGSRSRGFKLWAYSLLMAACAGLSLTIEFLQLWFPPRTVVSAPHCHS